jgi:shikimate kinase
VGRLVAAALGAEFVDLDGAIERRAGKSVQRIFAEDGEAAFRAIEADVGDAVLRARPTVLAPGGGFFTNDRIRGLARSSGLVVYLETDPTEAVRRLGGAAGRPLLAGGDPERKMASLLAARGALYRESECSVDTTGVAAEDVARRVVSLARDRAGW